MKILIADDETPIREWILFSIERGNEPDFEIAGVAENGNEAYDMALQSHVDIVITDIKMPGMDGLELMKKLQKEMPDIYFIILTNYADFSYAREAITFGAKKYFLKSELRGDDILAVLSEIHKEQQDRKRKSEEECYTNGFMDIYTCYHNRENADYRREFWQKHHFKDHMAFRILAVKSGDTSQQRPWIEDFAAAQHVHVLRPILRKDYIYLILQAQKPEGLTAAVREFCSLWKEKGLVVSGRTMTGIDQVMEGIEDVEKMLSYTFFYDSGYCSIEEMEKRERLDRENIKKEYHKILNSVLSEKEAYVSQVMEQWFGQIRHAPVQDILWARETCIKFCIRLEELFMEHVSNVQEEQAFSGDWTADICEAFCRNLMSRIYSDHNFSYSSCVREAVQYIHQHYGEQDLSLTGAAQFIYRSPEYLSRRFKLETGKNFSTYLMDYRISQAKNLLVHTDMKIYEVAYAVGFGTPSYFSKVYHDCMGVSPEKTRSQKSDRNTKK